MPRHQIARHPQGGLAATGTGRHVPGEAESQPLKAGLHWDLSLPSLQRSMGRKAWPSSLEEHSWTTCSDSITGFNNEFHTVLRCASSARRWEASGNSKAAVSIRGVLCPRRLLLPKQMPCKCNTDPKSYDRRSRTKERSSRCLLAMPAILPQCFYTGQSGSTVLELV